jgi:hypothetical protein
MLGTAKKDNVIDGSRTGAAGDKEPGVTDFDGNVVSLFSDDQDAARYSQALTVPQRNNKLNFFFVFFGLHPFRSLEGYNFT